MSGTNDSISSILPNRYISAMVINNSVAKRILPSIREKHSVRKGWGSLPQTGSWDSKRSFTSFCSVLSSCTKAKQASYYKIKLFGSLEWCHHYKRSGQRHSSVELSIETPSQVVVILPFTLPTYLLGLSRKFILNPIRTSI